MRKLSKTTYQVRASADGFKTYDTTVVAEWKRAKGIAKRLVAKHKVEARILTVRT
jgi:predicted GNAT family acetyltransferase